MSTAINVENRIDNIVVTDETITAHSSMVASLVCRWRGRGVSQMRHRRSGRTGSLSAMVMGCTGQMSMRI